MYDTNDDTPPTPPAVTLNSMREQLAALERGAVRAADLPGCIARIEEAEAKVKALRKKREAIASQEHEARREVAAARTARSHRIRALANDGIDLAVIADESGLQRSRVASIVSSTGGDEDERI